MEIRNEAEYQWVNRLADKAGEANTALWNSLLNANGLVLAAGAFVATPHRISQRLLIGLLVTVSVGGVSLVWNFRSTKNHRHSLGVECAEILSGKEVKTDTESAAKEHDRIHIRENIALTATGLSVLLVLAMILCP